MNRIVWKRSAGFTLIEMMISLVLGLLVLGAIGSVYIGSKRTSTSRDAMALLQENGRIAIRHLQAGIAPAGHPMELSIPAFIHSEVSDATGNEISVVPTTDGVKKEPTDTTACSNLTADTAAEDNTACPDTITIAFASDGGRYETNCLGFQKNTEVDGLNLIVNSFFVKDGVLMCKGSGDPNDSPQPIAEGIESMQVLYGVELEDRKLMLTADDLNTGSASPFSWEDVVVVQVALLVSSVKTGFTKDSGSSTYNLLGEVVTMPNDGKAYRVFTTTIPLRNRRVL